MGHKWILSKIKKGLGVAVLTAVLLFSSIGSGTGPAYANGASHSSYVLPGVGIGPFFIGMPIEQALAILVRDHGGYYTDESENYVSLDNLWAVSEYDGVTATPGKVNYVYTGDPQACLVMPGECYPIGAEIPAASYMTQVFGEDYFVLELGVLVVHWDMYSFSFLGNEDGYVIGYAVYGTPYVQGEK